MSSPVNSSPISSYVSPVDEKKEGVEETKGYNSDSSVESDVEVKTEKETLESEFQSLMFQYNHSISFTAGCGDRGQHYIDNAWQRLQDFVKEHPEFEARIP